ncbi:MAG TPA: hypothetical protein VG839_09550 [Asticcacaulis sp.]|nr:hypothetical protein [Asticcacaulis sp.]
MDLKGAALTEPEVAAKLGVMADVGAVKRGDNLYDVVYLGKASDSTEYMRDITLYQSAELCQANGFKYFKASDTQTYANHTTPDQANGETPKVTLQVSCLLAMNDAPVAYGVDTVINRVRTSYNLKY